MNLTFPSHEFDAAVGGVCHGTATEVQMRALNALLLNDPRARDEYLLRVELHTRLGSDPDLFSRTGESALGCRWIDGDLRALGNTMGSSCPTRRKGKRWAPMLALAACVVLAAAGLWFVWLGSSGPRKGSTSNAVAMLTRTVAAQWDREAEPPRAGGPLDPGWLRLESGMAQVVFYSGARVVIEGPAEVELLSPSEAFCRTGRLLVEVPEPARGFRLHTDDLDLVDLGTSFGVDVSLGESEVHVFKGKVELSAGALPKQALGESQAAVIRGHTPPRLIAADTTAFSSMFEFQQRSLASEAFRYEQWQFANAQLNEDPSLLVHLDLQNLSSTDWTLRNAAAGQQTDLEGVIVGCVRSRGRWREKQALEFQSVNDRVRLAVPGEFDSLTVSAWVCILGLDRQFNSLFMCDGFAPGTIHWLIRHDGVLGVTVFGDGRGRYQIMPSPAAVTVQQLGSWQHLAVVLDGRAGRVVQYLNGSPISRHDLQFDLPFRIGAAELGNWNAHSGPDPGPALIRNLSGALDEFALFRRALSDEEIRELYERGKP
ncbi:MAG: hypothetical protein RI897_3378 [Verrucomicrobiota bacterium]|jgi:hypothetical protein